MKFALALLLCGCLGPLLPMPAGEPRGAHAWLCVNRACPAEAMKMNGIVRHVGYGRGLCGCQLEDVRHMLVYVEVPPHEPGLVLHTFKR